MNRSDCGPALFYKIFEKFRLSHFCETTFHNTMAQRGGYKGGFRGGRNRPSPYGRQDRQKWKNKYEAGPTPEKMNRSWDEDGGIDEHLPGRASAGDYGRGDEQPTTATPSSGEERREKKFSNKARLFVGNLPRDFSEQQLRELFQESGEVQEVFVNKEKNFGFVRMVSKIMKFV